MPKTAGGPKTTWSRPSASHDTRPSLVAGGNPVELADYKGSSPVGVPAELTGEGIEPGVKEAFDTALREAEGLGALLGVAVCAGVRRRLPERALQLLGLWAITAIVLAGAYYTWNLWPW